MRRSTCLLLLMSCTSSDPAKPEVVLADDPEEDTYLADTAPEPPAPGEDAVLRIISPEDEDVLGPAFEVAWEVDGCDINRPSSDDEACHIHRYLDGDGMDEDVTDGFGLYEYVPFEVFDIEPGEHTIMIVLIPNDRPGGFDDSAHDDPITASVTFSVVLPDDTDLETQASTETDTESETETDDTDSRDSADTDPPDSGGADSGALDTDETDSDSDSDG